MEPYVGEIRMFAGNFAPQGWAFCNGQLLSIAENDVLFSLIGTTYGGDGMTTFALPDLRGRIPVHQGQSIFGTLFTIGSTGGTETVTLTQAQIPSHSHPLYIQSGQGNLTMPENAFWAKTDLDPYTTGESLGNLHPSAVSNTGGSQPHNNMMPSLCINFIIALYGAYPSRY